MFKLKEVFVVSAIAYCRSGAACFFCPVGGYCANYYDDEDRPDEFTVSQYAEWAFDEEEQQ